MYDFIGDIHGHADELWGLLDRLGYERIKGVFRHPDRKVIFLGDFVDRGPKIKQVLETVRPMVEEGHAFAVMGNHELNAIAFATEDRDAPGHHLRRQNAKNVHQHRATLEQLNAQERELYLDWFRSLPMWLEVGGVRAVHACWDDQLQSVIANTMRAHGGITNDFLHQACRKGGEVFPHVETILKGPESKLPAGLTFLDRYGESRSKVRTRWYLPPDGHTYRTYAFQADPIDCDLPVGPEIASEVLPYPIDAKPVFVGHYWLTADSPSVLASNVACLDYSVAKNGFLCAYRWDGEQSLSNDKFVWIARAK